MHESSPTIRAGLGLSIGIVIAGLIALTLAYGQGAYDRGYEVHAAFPTSSQGLFTDGGSLVKLRGINVGTVSSIELLPDGQADVTLFMNEGVSLPDTTMASIEPLSVFGPKFVRLEPGAHDGVGPYLGDGDEITETRTQRELTDILGSTTRLFDAIDPVDVITIIDTMAEGTAGLGPQIGRTIDASAVLAGVGARHTDELRQFLADVALLSASFADHADDLVAIAADVDDLVGLVNDDPARLDDLLATTTGISSAFSDLLRDNAEPFAATIESVAAFIAAVDAESDQIPELLDMIGTFFGRFSDVIRFDGPNGTKLAALRGFVSLDLCLVYGFCPGTTALSATAATTYAARGLQALDDASQPAPGQLRLIDALVGTTIGRPPGAGS